jgi:hypothetical protein
MNRLKRLLESQTPSEYTKKPVIGRILTTGLKGWFPPEWLDVIGHDKARDIYIVNAWYKEYKKVPQFVSGSLVQKFEPLNKTT